MKCMSVINFKSMSRPVREFVSNANELLWLGVGTSYCGSWHLLHITMHVCCGANSKVLCGEFESRFGMQNSHISNYIQTYVCTYTLMLIFATALARHIHVIMYKTRVCVH